MKIAFYNNKGGVGKTTLTINLAYLFAEMEKNILVVDCDKQRNSYNFLAPKYGEINSSNNTTEYDIFKTRYLDIAVTQHFPNLPENKEKIELLNEYLKQQAPEITLLDLPPAMNFETEKILEEADFVFVPIELSSFSISGIKTVIEAISKLDTVFGGVIINKFDKGNSSDLGMLETVKNALGDKVLNSIIPAAKPIKNSINYGKTAFEYMKWNKSVISLGELAIEILERTGKE